MANIEGDAELRRVEIFDDLVHLRQVTPDIASPRGRVVLQDGAYAHLLIQRSQVFELGPDLADLLPGGASACWL